MIHYTVRIFQIVAVFGTVSSGVYYLLCLWSVAAFLRERENGEGHPTQALPPVTILKPLKGNDPEMYESLRSHCLQDYPEYEIIFGVSDANDPAANNVQQLQQEFPTRRLR